MPRTPRTLLAALVCATLTALPACTAGVEPGATAVLSGARQAPSESEDSSVRPRQTSEGVKGEKVEPYPEDFFPRPRVSRVKTWKMAPGVRYRQWTQTDRRGKVKLRLVRVDPAVPGVSLDYASPTYVPQRDTVSGLLAADNAVAGINGGFFDISDTGAPLGVGIDRQRGFLHASRYTWNNAFFMTREGTPRIGRLKLTATIDQFPQIEVTNVNSPRVRVANVGIYTPAWGSTSGLSITDGQSKNIRMVVIEDGRVVANRTTLNRGKPIASTVLVGRGPGAAQLRQMRVGSLASVRYSMPGGHAMAISGEKVLLRDGQRLVENDSVLHPRTAVGIDRDNGKVLLLVVDGRSRASRGYTMVELARTLRALGAEDALNLDGGGSSTLVGRGQSGTRKVLNEPSDGAQRRVPDALQVLYSKP